MSEKSIWQETEFACNGGGGCVIVDRVADAIVIRDSKNPYQPGLVFSKKEYADFRRRVRGGSWPQQLTRLLVQLIKAALEYVRC
jgi:uncharacterized protein DUF397